MIPVFLLCLLLLSLTTACGSEKTAETLPSGEVAYYLSEYVDELSPYSDMIHRTVYTYDEKWRMTSWTSTTEGSDNDAEKTRAKFSYNDDGSIMTFTVKGSDVVTEFHRTFDENGNILVEEEYEGDILCSVTTREYDAQNRLISSFKTYPPKEYWDSDSQHNTYDAQGNLIVAESKTVLVDGTSFTTRTETTYDDQGRKLTEIHYSDGVLEYTYEYAYEGSTQTRTSTVPGQESEGRLVYTYDDYGNLLSIEAYGADSALQYRQFYSYIGTDGSVSSGIPELKE